MRQGRLIYAQLLVFVFTLGMFAVNAAACEGGAGGGELTSLSTELSGGGNEGEELAVAPGTKVKDRATLTGKNAAKATGKVSYKIYSNKTCTTLVKAAGEVIVSGESVPASSEEELEGGKLYYWQAHYGGDANNAESTSPCTEILDVVKCTFAYCEPTITPGVKLNTGSGTCTAGPVMTSGTETFLLTAGHCFGKKNEKTENIKQKVQSAYPKQAPTEKKVGENVLVNNSKKYDLAEVKIENTEWLLTGGGVPPVLVEWGEPPRIAYATGIAENLVREETCHSGATSGLQCGKILRTGVTESGTENLIEASGKLESGDSGSPEFVKIGSRVLIQGVAKSGDGFLTLEGEADVTEKSKLVTELLGEQTCAVIGTMKAMWPSVPIAGDGIPDNALVTKCAKEAGAPAIVEMNEEATATDTKVNVVIGYTELFYYEPISQVKALFPGQTLLVG